MWPGATAMLGTLIFAGVIVLLVGGLLGGALWLTRPKPGQMQMVFLAAAAGEAEARVWADRLRGTGIKVHVVNVGDSPRFTSPYAYEVWVRPKDEERARQVLGL